MSYNEKNDMFYFHVSPSADHPIDSTINPGNYGKLVRTPVQGAPLNFDFNFLLKIMVWEAVLETARLAVDPNLPSRFNCVFACTTREAAIAFRQKYRPPNSPIFKIEANDDLPKHVGDFDLISTSEHGQPLVDLWSKGAVKYWTEAPPGATEVIIGGPVKVVEKLSL